MQFLILAAGKSSRIYKNIKTHKCLIKIKKETLIKRIVKIAFKEKKINKINIVTGFLSNKIKSELKEFKINFLHNKNYKNKDMVYSMYLGLKNINDDVIISYSDIFYSKKILKKILLKKKNDILVPSNNKWLKIWKIRKKNPLIDCETFKYNKQYKLKEIGKKIHSIKDVMGQFMGIIYIPKKKLNFLKKLVKNNLKNNLQTTSLINLIIKKGIKVKVLENKSFWYEFDDYQDVKYFKKY